MRHLGAGAQSLLEDYTPVTEDMLVNPPDGEWLMWRRNYGHWGYSPLDQIDRENVAGLRLAWAWTMERGLQETTPLVHDGVMFLPQACDFVEAVDARDGTLLWTYRRERVEHAATLACANRNATLYQDRLYIATHDAYLVALDARTGEVVWEQQVGNWEVGQHYSGGPQIINGRVVAGMSGCYYINTRCWISAHDADTGEEVWRTHTIAYEGEPGGDSWGDLPNEQRRGGIVLDGSQLRPGAQPDLRGSRGSGPVGPRATGRRPRRRRALYQLDSRPRRGHRVRSCGTSSICQVTSGTRITRSSGSSSSPKSCPTRPRSTG